MTLISTVGGASGPLYGSFFLQLGTATAGKADIAARRLRRRPGQRRRPASRARQGRARRQDDARGAPPRPQTRSTRLPTRARPSEALAAGAAAAEEGMLATIPLVARKGRASYLGERSAGHQDPGATSTHLLLKAAADTWPRARAATRQTRRDHCMAEYVGAPRPGHDEHPVHDLRPRRPASSRSTRRSTSRSSRSPAGSSTTRRRSGRAARRSSRAPSTTAGITGERPRRGRHHQPARDDRGLGPAHRQAVYNAIVWQDTRTDAIVDELAATTAARTASAPRPACRWRRTSPAPRSSGCWTTSTARAREAEAGELLFGTIDTWCLEPHRRHRRRRPRHRRDQRQPHDADEPRDARLGRRDLGVIGIPRSMLPAIRPRREVYGDGDGRRSPGIPSPATSATSRRPCSARPASPPARPRTPTAPAASCCSTPARSRCRRRAACSRRVGYKFGDQPAGLRAGGLDRRHRRARAVAARQPRADRERRRRSRRWPRRSTTTAASTSCRRSPACSRRTGSRDARGVIAGLTRYVNKGHLARAVARGHRVADARGPRRHERATPASR